MKYLATPSSIFISSSSTGELSALSQSETRFVEQGEYSQNMLSEAFWTPNTVRWVLQTIFAKQKSAQLRISYIHWILQLCSWTNVRPIKNGYNPLPIKLHFQEGWGWASGRVGAVCTLLVRMFLCSFSLRELTCMHCVYLGLWTHKVLRGSFYTPCIYFHSFFNQDKYSGWVGVGVCVGCVCVWVCVCGGGGGAVGVGGGRERWWQSCGNIKKDSSENVISSRGTFVQIRFGSPFTSKVVVCGHCLVTLSLTNMKH